MSRELWTVRRILAWIEEYLGGHGDERPDLSARLLVSDALDVSQMDLFMDPDRPLNAEERSVLRDYTKRRAAGEPIQYITGKAAFRHISVRVRRGVLIPRPETEVLVSEALALLPAAVKPQETLEDDLMRARGIMQAEQLPFEQALAKAQATRPNDERTFLVADICTGTGCIACSIAQEHPATRVVATDISHDAVLSAGENVHELGLDERVRVIECDLGSGVDESSMGSFDLVVSNPPYVPTEVLGSVPREVADFEPVLALDGGDDGLGVYRRLLVWSARALADGGAFACELHETCLEEAAVLAQDEGFEEVRVCEDLVGRPRVLTARRKSRNGVRACS